MPNKFGNSKFFAYLCIRKQNGNSATKQNKQKNEEIQSSRTFRKLERTES